MSLWNLSLLAGHGLTSTEGTAVRAFNVTTFHSGWRRRTAEAGRALGDTLPLRRAQRAGRDH